MSNDLFYHLPQKFRTTRFTDGLFEDEYLVIRLYAIGQRVGKVGGFSSEGIYFSSWWSILDAKLAVPGSMDLVTDMAT